MLNNNNLHRYVHSSKRDFITSIIKRINPTNDGSGNVVLTTFTSRFKNLNVHDCDLTAKIKAGANLNFVPPIVSNGFHTIDNINNVSNNL